MRDFLYICTMEKVTIYKFQLETILEALRITSNIHNCSEGKTCFDRQVRQAYEYSEEEVEKIFVSIEKYLKSIKAKFLFPKEEKFKL